MLLIGESAALSGFVVLLPVGPDGACVEGLLFEFAAGKKNQNICLFVVKETYTLVV